MRLHNICTCTIINRITGKLNKNNLMVLFTTQLGQVWSICINK